MSFLISMYKYIIMNPKRLLYLLGLLALLPSIFAASYYYKVINPNDYPVTDYQLRIDLNSINPSLVNQPIAQITNLNTGQTLSFCYEQSNLECSSEVSDTGYIWVKIDSIPAKDYVIIRIDSDGSTNGASTGGDVFDYYDDFNDNDISDWVQVVQSGTITVNNGVIHFEVTDPNPNENDPKENLGFAVLKKYQSDINLGTSMQTVEIYVRDIQDVDGDNGIHLTDDTAGTWQFYVADSETYSTMTHIAIGGWNVLHPNIGAVQNHLASVSTRLFDNPLQASEGVWYVLSLTKIDPYTYKATVYDGSYSVLKESPITKVQYATDAKIYLGAPRVNHDPADNQDTSISEIDWIRVRKYIDQELILQQTYSQAQLSQQTTSQQSTTYQQTYDYVKIKYIAGLNGVAVNNIAIPIVVNTQEWINEGKLQSDCSDLYVTYYDPNDNTEKPASFFVDKETCNTPDTVIYVKLPQIASDQDIQLFIYHGVPGTALPYEDPKNTFYFFVDLSNPTDVNNNLDIFTQGDANYEITDQGLHVTTGSDGYVAIYNK